MSSARDSTLAIPSGSNWVLPIPGIRASSSIVLAPVLVDTLAGFLAGRMSSHKSEFTIVLQVDPLSKRYRSFKCPQTDCVASSLEAKHSWLLPLLVLYWKLWKALLLLRVLLLLLLLLELLSSLLRSDEASWSSPVWCANYMVDSLVASSLRSSLQATFCSNSKPCSIYRLVHSNRLFVSIQSSNLTTILTPYILYCRTQIRISQQ